MRSARIFLCLTIVGCTSLLQGQSQTEAAYRIDYAHHFFATPEAERAARATLMRNLDALRGLKGHLGESATALLQGLQQRDVVAKEYRKHDAYLYLLYCDDTRNEDLLAEERQLSALVSESTAYFEDELLSLDSSRLRNWEEQEPALRQYEFALSQRGRERDHSLPPEQEGLLRMLAPETVQWQGDLFGKLREQSRATQRSGETRRQAFDQLHVDLDRKASLYGFALNHLATALNQSAKLHGYTDAAERSYAASFLSQEEVGDLLQRLAASAQVFKDYQQIRIDHFKAQAGVADAGPWDLEQSRSPAAALSLTETRRVLSAALAPLGTDYLRELDSLLDPANGRLDVGGDSRRKATGFSMGFVGFPSVLYVGHFDGSYGTVRALTHEAGHAVHRQLMGTVPPAYAEGPHFLFESFATFNELLLADYLYHTATTPQTQQFYLEQFFDGKGMEMFRDAPEAALEQAIYERNAASQSNSVEDLNKLALDIYSRYSIWPERLPELRHQWMQIPLMYEDPFYDLNYVYASLLALKYFQMSKANPSEFQRRYIALLKSGFDAPPADLLQRSLGINLNDPAVLAEDLAVLREKLDELRAIYAAAPGGRSTVRDPEPRHR